MTSGLVPCDSTCDVFLQEHWELCRPSALGMSDPVMESLEILETKEIPDILKVLKGMKGTKEAK